MKCKKRRYRDELDAKLALSSTGKNAHHRKKEEIRFYKCRFCNGYHLTSQQYRVREYA